MYNIKTNKGDILIKLHDDKTPVTADNFKTYVEQKFYDGTVFHRVIPGFMIQGGGMTPDLENKSTNAPVENEAANAHKNLRGTVAMARTMDPHSATSQFFINVADNHFLNYTGSNPQGYGYCVFGEVVEGMDVVDAIAAVKTGRKGMHADVPMDDVLIHSITKVD